MSDPAVYNDHREAADVGRRLKELEGPYEARAAVAAGARRSRRGAQRRRAAEMVADYEAEVARLEEELKLVARRARPRRRQGRDRRGARRRRRRRGRLWAGDLAGCCSATRSGAASSGRSSRSRRATRRAQGRHVRDQGRRRVLDLQVRGRHASRAARAGDRVAGPHPHLDRDRRGDAGGRGCRRRDRGERPEDRRLPLVGPGRPVGEHDRLGGAHHARADRHRRRDAGRALAAAEPREGDARAARAHLRGGARAAGGRAGGRRAARRSAAASARRRSAPTTSRRTASPTTA